MADVNSAEVPTSEGRMSWWRSVRVAGWSGGKLAAKTVDVSIGALRDGLRGQRRIDAANARIAWWRERIATKGRLTFEEVLTHLSLDSSAGGSSPIAFVDIELGSDDAITQIGLALPVGDQLVLAEGAIAEAATLTLLLSERWIISHNGADHDFPRLRDALVGLPRIQIDSLKWSWLAWPSEQSHALGALVEQFASSDIDVSNLHDAVEDALALAKVWEAMCRELRAIDPAERIVLRQALTGIENDAVLEELLGSDDGSEAAELVDGWRPDAGSSPAGFRVCDQSTFERSGGPEGSVHVVESLREAFVPGRTPGALALASTVLDPTAVAGARRGWSTAIARRVLTQCRGWTALGPAAATELLSPLCRRDPGLLVSAGSPLVSDLATVSIQPPDHPLVIDVDLASLFEPIATGVTIGSPPSVERGSVVAIADLPSRDRVVVIERLKAKCRPELAELAEAGVGSLQRSGGHTSHWLIDPLDIGQHEHGVDLVLRGPVGGSRSSTLWRHLLGEDVAVVGAQHVDLPWTGLTAHTTSSRLRPGRRTAQLLGVAARLEAGNKNVVVVDAADHRRAIERIARRLWRERYRKPLLRPPDWPTYDEAQRRLRTGKGTTSLVGSRAARVLGPMADYVLMARAPWPPAAQRTMRRLLTPELTDPYGDVVEPLAAHLFTELLSKMTTTDVIVADTALGAGVVSELTGPPREVHLAELDLDEALVSELLSSLAADAARPEVRTELAAAATRRLLGPEGELREFQRIVIDDVMADKDVVGVFRTGLGKSICYQVPALAWAASDAVTVVISPLIALQRNQLEGLRRRGVSEAAIYNSEMTAELRAAVRRGIEGGFYRVILMAPDALWGHGIRKTLGEVRVGLVAVDEAHCISEMGHDFRPDFRTISRSLARTFGYDNAEQLKGSGERPTILALTGTANPAVLRDIREVLG